MKKDFFYKYGFHIIFVVVFLLSFIWMGTRATIQSNSNSVEDWLPNRYRETLDYKWFLQHFPFERFIVASWDGCTLDDERVELFAQKLVPEQTIDNFTLSSVSTDLKAELDIHQVQNRLHQEALRNRELEGGETVDHATDSTDATSLSDRDYFKSVMTGPRLVRLLKESYKKTPQLKMTPEELDREIRERLKGTLVGPDGNSTALIITLPAGRRDGTYHKNVIARLKEISVECGLPDTVKVKSGSFAARIVENLGDLWNEILHGRETRMDGLILGGPPTDNVALDQEGERTLFRLAGLCALIGGTLAYVCLRSIRLTMFVFWISVLAAGVALAMVSLTGGTCDSILLSMPALVYVLAMSGSIHLINYYHDAIRENGLRGAPERALEHGFSPCFFAQLTTAIGLGSLFVSQLVPITKFGFYSAVGVMTTLLLLFLYLPSLLYFYPSKKFAQQYGGKGLDENHGFFSQFWTKFGKFIIDWHNVVALVCLALMIFFACNLFKAKTSVKMMNFFSADAEIIKHYTWLEDKLGPLVPMELVVSFDNARLDKNIFGNIDRLNLINEICDELKSKQSEDIGGTLSVGMFVPDLDVIGNRESITYRLASAVAGKSIDENRQSLKDYLSIEGNPSLAEMGESLKNRIDTLSTDFEKNKETLKAKMAKAGCSLDAELTSLLTPSLHQNLSALGDPAKIASFKAELQKLAGEKKELDEMTRLFDFFNVCQSTLSDEGLIDLNHIVTLPNDRNWRKLTREEIVQLQEVAEIWRQERGVELWRISIRVWALKKNIDDYSRLIKDVQRVVEPILKKKSDEIMALKAEIGERSDKTAESTGPKSTGKVLDPAIIAKVKAQANIQDEDIQVDLSMGDSHCFDHIYPAGITAKYTGMVPLVYKTQHMLIKGLVESLIMAFFLICIVMMFVLKSVPGGLVAMIPNLFPVVCVFGYMAWQGILIDVGIMMTASVALGVAIDDTMHYLTWFSDGIHRGQTAKEAALNAYRRCAAAMTESTIICGFGLSAFAFSTFVPTQKFGILMLTILVVALIGDLIFLPALLTGPLGRFFVMKRKRKSQLDDLAGK